MNEVTDGERLASWLPLMQGRRVLVIGDLCLDEYLIGRAERLSREAPIPVLEHQTRFCLPGAAANPALNVQALGGVALAAGVVGDDAEGRTLREALAERGIDVSCVVADPSRCTTVKTRILAEVSLRFPQQIARIDRQERRPLDRRVQHDLLARVRAAEGADAILISDYKSGVVNRGLVQAAILLGEERGALVTVDSQGDLGKFRGVTTVKCNREDAEMELRRRLRDDDGAARACAALQRRLSVAGVVITRGADGLSLRDGEGAALHLPALARTEVVDVTGAGDTVIAVMTLALAAGAPLAGAAALANVAAGLVVRRLGNATTTVEELRRAVLGAAEPVRPGAGHGPGQA